MNEKHQVDLAIYLPSLRGGGAERVMATLAEAFFRRGFRVELVLVQAEGPYLRNVPSAVKVVNLGGRRVSCSLPHLVRYLRRERPRAMLSAMGHANIVAICARALAGVATRLVVSERTTWTSEASARSGLSARLMAWLIRSLYPRADAIVGVSDGAADALARFAGLPRESVITIYNPFDLDAIEERADEPLSHPWFAHGEPPLVLAIGRLTAAKDFPTLVEAFSKVCSIHPARLMILGEGEERAQLQQLAEYYGLYPDKFALPGFVTNPFPYLRRCGVFVLSSRWEGLPGALIEALACGASVVATDCCSGPAEILENGKWGRLVPVGRSDALAEAIVEALGESKLRPSREPVRRFALHNIVSDYQEALGL